MYWIIIYFIGFLICYIWIKKMRNEVDDNEWEHVFITFLLSVFSWLTLLILSIAHIAEYFNKYINRRDPPKWL